MFVTSRRSSAHLVVLSALCRPERSDGPALRTWSSLPSRACALPPALVSLLRDDNSGPPHDAPYQYALCLLAEPYPLPAHDAPHVGLLYAALTARLGALALPPPPPG